MSNDIFSNLKNDMFSRFKYIKQNDEKYIYVNNLLITRFFPLLVQSDKTVLTDAVVILINYIIVKYNIVDNNAYWHQLTQNNMADLRALLNLCLPFIDDNDDKKKAQLINLKDLFLKKNGDKYYYTNSQYNRCVREVKNIIERPYLLDYFTHHLYLLLMSIESISNKLYVNWIDVLPIPMNKYKQTQIYLSTIDKMNSGQIILYKNYIDVRSGLSFQEMYNVICNQLFNEIKNIKWLIYDIMTSSGSNIVLNELEKVFDMEPIWNKLSWYQLKPERRETFINNFNTFINTRNTVNNLVITHLYFFFYKYHNNSTKLIEDKLLKTISSLISDDDIEDISTPPSNVIDEIKNAIENVPREEFYLFFYNQLNDFRKTWYYYRIKIKGDKYIDTGDNINLTYKNIYNYSKSITHYLDDDPDPSRRFTSFPNYWNSLKVDHIGIFTSRLLDLPKVPQELIIDNDMDENYTLKINDRSIWFNISKYIVRLYIASQDRNATLEDIRTINNWILQSVKKNIIDIIFESLIYHGLLSEFKPNPKITDNNYIESQINSVNMTKNKLRLKTMKETVFTSDTRKDYEQNSYYYVTSESYDRLSEIKSKEYVKSYFDFLMSDQNWTFTYAMNWISQTNFYHHYINNRVMFVTGATGVGKSTEVPKLLYYSQKMIDYNLKGKIICTQPRIPPTEAVTDIVSKNMGIPIKEYVKEFDEVVATNNYYLQFKHQKNNHIDKSMKSFLRFVTDGTLFAEMKNYPFLTKPTQSDNWKSTYSDGNIYDIIIIDEAHEHNTNMDMILTLARDACYVNNSLKLVIVSATMDDDEPVYRRYYRMINDNRSFPLSSYIQFNDFDRINMDRRIHISPPGKTTQYHVEDCYLSKEEADLIDEKNFVQDGIDFTIKLMNRTTSGHALLFMSGMSDIIKSVEEINRGTNVDVICFPYYSELSDEMKNFIITIHRSLGSYTRDKSEVLFDDDDVTKSVPLNTYKRAVIIATNVAEASLTLEGLKYVIDTGFAKIMIYDPISNSSELKTLRISQSSSVQRRGRVGRIAEGIVYYRYDKERVIHNKTSYKIAESDIRGVLSDLIKTQPLDYPIIDSVNDINNYDNLISIKDRIDVYRYDRDNSFLFFILKNPIAYLQIINKKYRITQKELPYYYLGKFDPSIKSIATNYFIECHEDYDFYSDHSFKSRGFTGYDDITLCDFDAEFYIIHPDENIIGRNPYTGKVNKIEILSSVDEQYYEFLLDFNHVSSSYDTFLMIQYINKRGIADNLILPKTILAMNNIRLTNIVFESTITPIRTSALEDKLPEDTDIIDVVDSYYEYINTTYDIVGLVKTSFATIISKISTIYDQNVLRNWNALLWFTFMIPLNYHIDVLAIEIFIQTNQSVKTFMNKIKDKKNTRQIINKYSNVNKNTQGDIYFVYSIWKSIKDILVKTNILQMIDIKSSDKTTFNKLKHDYYSDDIEYVDDYLLMHNLFRTGVLGGPHDYYYYIKQFTIDIEVIMSHANLNIMLRELAKRHYLDYSFIDQFVRKIISELFAINKNEWIYNYEIENELTEDGERENVILWIKNNLHINSVLGNRTEWDYIFEGYLKAYVTNLMYNDGEYYYQIQSGDVMMKQTWTRNVKSEVTFLKNKTQYIVYHNSEVLFDNTYGMLLTPVLIDWMVDSNPIYYYLLLNDNKMENGIISWNKLTEDSDPKIMNIIRNDITSRLTPGLLIKYIDKFPDENVRSLITNIRKN